jgi:putative addiction module killer protein
LRDTKARVAIDRRINRVELGNFGDHKFCRDGVWELRIDIGAGYRVYYAMPAVR